MKDNSLDIQVEPHSDGIGSHEDVARMVGIVEVLSLWHFHVGRQTSINQSGIDPAFFQLPRHAVKIFFAEGNNRISCKEKACENSAMRMQHEDVQ